MCIRDSSDSNLAPTATLHDVLELKAHTGHSTIAVTADGTPNGKLLGIVASRDYRVNHTPDDALVTTFMTPIDKLVTAPENTSLHDCNNIIWDNKINTLPLVDAEGNLKYLSLIHIWWRATPTTTSMATRPFTCCRIMPVQRNPPRWTV